MRSSWTPARTEAAAIQSLKPEDQVFAVKLPGYGPVSFTQTAGVRFWERPEKKPTDYAGVLEIPSANNADHFRFYYYTEQPENRLLCFVFITDGSVFLSGIHLVRAADLQHIEGTGNNIACGLLFFKEVAYDMRISSNILESLVIVNVSCTLNGLTEVIRSLLLRNNGKLKLLIVHFNIEPGVMTVLII